MPEKRTTYLLWLFLGWTGAHHAYLGRFYHAFVWFATLGGGCGIGWVRDFWRIPEYLSWNTSHRVERKKLIRKTLSSSKPECSLFRQTGMTLMSAYMSTILAGLVPDFSQTWESNPVTYWLLYLLYAVLLIVGNALGAYLVANIGEMRCSMFYPLLSSLSLLPVLYLDGSWRMLASSLTTWLVRKRGIQWRHFTREDPPSAQYQRRLFLYMGACLVWSVVVVSAMMIQSSNPEAETQGTPTNTLRTLLMSEAFQNVTVALNQLNSIVFHHGVSGIFKDMLKPFDFRDTVKAYKILGVLPGTNQHTISKTCRKLLAATHPDRFRDLLQKEEAESKYLEITHACSILSTTRSYQARDE